MHYEFFAYGHPNIKATHKTTIEFTKEKELTTRGNCIVGVNSDFDLSSLKNFIKNKSLIGKSTKIIISTKNKKEEINAELNPGFDDDKEIVIRKSGFISKRTFAVQANKAAVDLKLGKKLKSGKDRITIRIN